jgi:hypothetical protein
MGELGCGPGVETGRRPGPEPFRARAGRRRAVLDGVRPELEEPGADGVRERDVQPVQPGHGRVGLVVVAVEAPAGGEQEVAAAHRHRVAVDHRPDALALHDEPEGVLGVPVHRRVLARVEVLDGRPQRRRRERRPAQARVGQRDRPPLAAAAHRDEVAGPLGQPQQALPAPHVRGRGRARAGRHQVADLGPQRHQQRGLEAAVELVELGRGRRLPRRVHRPQPHRGRRRLVGGRCAGAEGGGHGCTFRVGRAAVEATSDPPERS